MAREGMTLSWSRRARQQLRDILTEIRAEDKLAARRFHRKLKELAEGLREHPMIGRVVPEFSRQDLRERIYGNYRLVYLVTGSKLEIVALYHTRQMLPDVL